MSSIVSVLFPAVELGDFHSFGNFNVGVVDVYLPINLNFRSSIPGTEHVTPTEQDHATVRILYPTHDEPISIPYLRPHTSKEYCEQNMKHSAPPPLRPFSWMIHNWRLVHLPGRHHAEPTIATADGTTEHDGLLPIVFFSHGLGGSAEMYAYQTHALAKHGYIVIVIDHTDGSAPVVPRKDGTMLLRNDTIIQHWLDGDKEYYKLQRQTMTDYRAQELLSVVDSVVHLNEENIPELEEVGLDFRNTLDTSNIHYMGHSFGGATTIHAAMLSSKPPRSVVTHDPACDWLPESSRLALFDIERLQESYSNHSYWTRNTLVAQEGKKDEEKEDNDENKKLDRQRSLHDITEILTLFSDEWYERKWSGSDVLKDMYDRNVFGPASGKSIFKVIDDAHHSEFSDASQLTPLWIARAVGLTGPRNPIDTAEEIHLETLDFLKSVQ
eukprot:CAMPEP_0113523814 /NCGR_PEP_ID=MMETSP0014_2-20120614/45895_1 /TAXON_ID=2857 /ORGANISM="Nitzschia sp." /LENGTH=438 /DNA_ID=CAMNT_0000421907 /DNA_START=240 /DNA_END=1556 /DNA_ORIENTATION=+ /assembly_acc=CAM_ASM_000159